MQIKKGQIKFVSKFVLGYYITTNNINIFIPFLMCHLLLSIVLKSYVAWTRRNWQHPVLVQYDDFHVLYNVYQISTIRLQNLIFYTITKIKLYIICHCKENIFLFSLVFDIAVFSYSYNIIAICHLLPNSLKCFPLTVWKYSQICCPCSGKLVAEGIMNTRSLMYSQKKKSHGIRFSAKQDPIFDCTVTNSCDHRDVVVLCSNIYESPNAVIQTKNVTF